YEGLHDFRPYPVGHADHAHHGDSRVLHQAFLDLARADPVAARGDDVVVAALEEDVAVLVDAAEVAGQQPVAGELGGRGLGIAPVLQHDDRVVPPTGDLAFLAGRQHVAGWIDDGDLAARAGAAT